MSYRIYVLVLKQWNLGGVTSELYCMQPGLTVVTTLSLKLYMDCFP